MDIFCVYFMRIRNFEEAISIQKNWSKKLKRSHSYAHVKVFDKENGRIVVQELDIVDGGKTYRLQIGKFSRLEPSPLPLTMGRRPCPLGPDERNGIEKWVGPVSQRGAEFNVFLMKWLFFPFGAPTSDNGIEMGTLSSDTRRNVPFFFAYNEQVRYYEKFNETGD